MLYSVLRTAIRCSVFLRRRVSPTVVPRAEYPFIDPYEEPLRKITLWVLRINSEIVCRTVPRPRDSSVQLGDY